MNGYRLLNILADAFKYGSMILTAGFAIWSGLRGDLKRTLPDGGWRLTGAGHLFVGLTLACTLVGLGAVALKDIVERQKASRAESERLAREEQRNAQEERRAREIALASTRLRSLDISWSFDRLPTGVTAFLEKSWAVGQEVISQRPAWGGASQEEREEYRARFERFFKLYPFLSMLGSGYSFGDSREPLQWSIDSFRPDDAGFIHAPPISMSTAMLLSLNENHSAVMSLGFVDVEGDATSRGGLGAARSLELREEMDVIFENLSTEPQRTRRGSLIAEFVTNRSKGTIIWHVPVDSIDQMIDQLGSETTVSAAFPRKLRIVVFGHMRDLPFSLTCAASTNQSVPWDEPPNSDAKEPYGPSTLSLCPNNLTDMRVDYRVTLVTFRKQLITPNGREYSANGGPVTVWEAIRSDNMAKPHTD
jgi:hypothetical protein